jgi:hypothetical protein
LPPVACTESTDIKNYSNQGINERSTASHNGNEERFSYANSKSIIMQSIFFLRYHDWGFSTTLVFSDSACTLVGGDTMIGSEDIVMLGLPLFLLNPSFP